MAKHNTGLQNEVFLIPCESHGIRRYDCAACEKVNQKPENIKAKLEYLRGEIEAERISYGEIAELQSLAEHIEPGDVLLLEWAGIPEFPEMTREWDCTACELDGVVSTTRWSYDELASQGSPVCPICDSDMSLIAETK